MVDGITADKARKLTEQSISAPEIENFVSAIGKKIKQLAKEGKSELDPWKYLSSLRMMSPTAKERKAIRTHFESAGFTWVNYQDPDPGNPVSRPYTILSW